MASIDRELESLRKHVEDLSGRSADLCARKTPGDQRAAHRFEAAVIRVSVQQRRHITTVENREEVANPLFIVRGGRGGLLCHKNISGKMFLSDLV
jgi:hypothetical protein